MDISTLGREDSWAGIRVLVLGFDPDGQSAADNLLHLGASVTVLDSDASEETTEFADLLGVLGADVRRGGSLEGVVDCDLIVVSGMATALLHQAQAAHPRAVTMTALDLARQFQPDQAWLLVGAKDADDTTADRIVAAATAMLRAAGVAAAPAGGRHASAMEIVMEPERHEALVIAVTPRTLAVSGALRPHSSCVLIDEPGLSSIFTDVEHACLYKPELRETENMVAEAEVIDGARAIGITCGVPGLSMLGVVDDVLCDRAFVEERRTSAAEICTLAELSAEGEEYVEAMLAAVGLARAYGVALAEIRTVIGETF